MTVSAPVFDEDEIDGPRREETKRLARVLRVMARLTSQPNQWTRARLAGAFEVGARSIDRGLELLRGLGYEITRSRGQGYAFAHAPPLPPVPLSLQDVLPLAIAATVLAGLLTGCQGPVLYDYTPSARPQLSVTVATGHREPRQRGRVNGMDGASTIASKIVASDIRSKVRYRTPAHSFWAYLSEFQSSPDLRVLQAPAELAEPRYKYSSYHMWN